MSHDTKQNQAFLAVFTGLIVASIVCGVIAFPTKARAQTVSTYVGLHAGYGMSSTELSDGVSSINGIGAKGLMGGVHGGVDMYLPSSMWFIGVWGAYDFSKMDAKLSTPFGSASARLGDAWSVGGRVGLSKDKMKPYVLLGYKQAETSVSGLGVVPMPTLKGLVYGVGLDYSLANNLSVGAQATMTKFDAADIGATGIAMKPEALELTLRLNLQIGAPVATTAAPLK